MKPPDRIEKGKGKTRYFLGHRQVSRKVYRALYPKPAIGEGVVMGEASYKKPIHSSALGYHVDQIPEAREHLAKLGVPTEIDKTGRPVFTSRQHRRKALKALNYHDNDSFTGY